MESEIRTEGITDEEVMLKVRTLMHVYGDLYGRCKVFFLSI